MSIRSISTRTERKSHGATAPLEASFEVLVSAEDDAEVRRISITNSGSRTRDIEITSYAELALGPQNADVAHPAFAKFSSRPNILSTSGRSRHAPTSLAPRSRESGPRMSA